jgi:hypothetical protein
MDRDRRGRRRLRRAIVGSVLAHVLLAALIGFLVRLPAAAPSLLKKGEPLIVDLTDPNQPLPLGNPSSKDLASPGPATKAPAPPGNRERPAPPPSPPRGPAAKPAPEKSLVAKSAPEKPPAAKPARAEPPKVASTPPPAVAPPTPSPSQSETPAREEPKESPAPRSDAVAKAPEPPAEPARPTPSPSAGASAPQSNSPTEAAPSMRADVPSAQGDPTSRRSVPDIRTALRGGGGSGIAGGGGSPRGVPGGRGGILGEAVPLESKDPRFGDYIERVRRAIQEKMVRYPCIKNATTFECEPKNAELVIEFGILKNGGLQFLELRLPSGMAVYDDYSANAIKLASFPAIPPEIMQTRPPGSTGIPIAAHFMYRVELSFRSFLQ